MHPVPAGQRSLCDGRIRCPSGSAHREPATAGEGRRRRRSSGHRPSTPSDAQSILLCHAGELWAAAPDRAWAWLDSFRCLLLGYCLAQLGEFIDGTPQRVVMAVTGHEMRAMFDRSSIVGLGQVTREYGVDFLAIEHAPSTMNRELALQPVALDHKATLPLAPRRADVRASSVRAWHDRTLRAVDINFHAPESIQ